MLHRDFIDISWDISLGLTLHREFIDMI
jgi:hypothetical protein